MILKGIYCTFWIRFGINFGGFEFYVDGNVGERIIHVWYYFFLTYISLLSASII